LQRVVHILYQFSYGGMEVVLTNMINNMDDKKFEHHIVSLNRYSADMQSRLKNNTKIYSVNKQPGKDIMFYFRLRKLLKELQPDIIHTYNIGAIDAILASFLLKKSACFHSEHGRDISDPEGKNKKYNILRKYLSLLFTKYVVISTELRNWLVNCVGVSADKIAVIVNGVDTELFSPKTANEKNDIKMKLFNTNSLLVGTVGRMDPIKNHVFLVAAFFEYLKNNPEADVKLLLVGDGQCFDEIKAFVNQHNISNNVILSGAMENIHDVMSALDIYVQSSIAEGMPMTILEAMSSGLPVISTDVGGIAEIVEDGENGILVQSADVKELSSAIESLVKDKNKVIQYGVSARSRIVEFFSLKRMCAQYAKLYQRD